MSSRLKKYVITALANESRVVGWSDDTDARKAELSAPERAHPALEGWAHGYFGSAFTITVSDVKDIPDEESKKFSQNLRDKKSLAELLKTFQME